MVRKYFEGGSELSASAFITSTAISACFHLSSFLSRCLGMLSFDKTLKKLFRTFFDVSRVWQRCYFLSRVFLDVTFVISVPSQSSLNFIFIKNDAVFVFLLTRLYYVPCICAYIQEKQRAKNAFIFFVRSPQLFLSGLRVIRPSDLQVWSFIAPPIKASFLFALFTF